MAEYAQQALPGLAFLVAKSPADIVDDQQLAPATAAAQRRMAACRRQDGVRLGHQRPGRRDAAAEDVRVDPIVQGDGQHRKRACAARELDHLSRWMPSFALRLRDPADAASVERVPAHRLAAGERHGDESGARADDRDLAARLAAEWPPQRLGVHCADVLEFDFKYDGLGAGTLAFNNVSGIGRGGTGVLKVDGDVGNKKAYDPRAWGKAGEAGMSARVVEACENLRSTGHTIG